MNNNISKGDALDNILEGLLTLTEHIIDTGRRIKSLQDQVNNIQVSISTLKSEMNSHSIQDNFNIVNNNINKLDETIRNNSLVPIDSNVDSKDLTGKKIAQLKEMGMSWNTMTVKYNIPKSTLQYRYRVYKREKAGDIYDSDKA